MAATIDTATLVAWHRLLIFPSLACCSGDGSSPVLHGPFYAVQGPSFFGILEVTVSPGKGVPGTNCDSCFPLTNFGFSSSSQVVLCLPNRLERGFQEQSPLRTTTSTKPIALNPYARSKIEKKKKSQARRKEVILNRSLLLEHITSASGRANRNLETRCVKLPRLAIERANGKPYSMPGQPESRTGLV